MGECHFHSLLFPKVIFLLTKGQQKLTKISDLAEEGLSYLQLFYSIRKALEAIKTSHLSENLQKTASCPFYPSPTLLLASYLLLDPWICSRCPQFCLDEKKGKLFY